MGQPLGRAGDGAGTQIQPKAHLFQQRQFPAQIGQRPQIVLPQQVQQGHCAGIKRRVGFAIGQAKGQQRSDRVQPGQRHPV